MRNIPHYSSFTFLVVACVLMTNTRVAQDVNSDAEDSKMYSNAIYGAIGVGGLWITATGYYERMLPRDAAKTNLSTFIKVGYGGVAYWEDQSGYIQAQFGILTGINKHHFEASAGYVKALDEFDLFPIAATIGYRIQKPKGHFVFRTGLGWPEAIYFGVCVSF